MNEQWTQIKGYGRKYEISNTGIIRIKPKIKATYKSRIGYLHTNFYENGKAKMQSVHRLVAKHFVPNPKKKPHVNHKDGNKENNNASNLEWVTRSENMRHSVDIIGNIPWNKGKKKTPCAKGSR